jgi:hypothetical protein
MINDTSIMSRTPANAACKKNERTRQSLVVRQRNQNLSHDPGNTFQFGFVPQVHIQVAVFIRQFEVKEAHHDMQNQINAIYRPIAQVKI